MPKSTKPASKSAKAKKPKASKPKASKPKASKPATRRPIKKEFVTPPQAFRDGFGPFAKALYSKCDVSERAKSLAKKALEAAYAVGTMPRLPGKFKVEYLATMGGLVKASNDEAFDLLLNFVRALDRATLA